MALILSDALLAYLHHYPVMGAWTLFSYSGFAGVVLVGAALTAQSSLLRYLATISMASFAFWVWTNFGVWLLSGMYLHSINGLLACYIAALPFLRNALLGDLLWMVSLFYLMRLALHDDLITCQSRHNLFERAGMTCKF